MNNKQFKVAVTRQLPEPVETRMKELFDVNLSNSPHPLTREKLLEIVQDCDALVPTIGDKIDGSFIKESGKKLKLIANYGVGFDHIDVLNATKRGITVTNTPNVLQKTLQTWPWP